MSEKLLMKGNEALAEGAVRAGCRFFAGYPITPQNEVPEYLSHRLPEVGGAFIQAESEVAAINMVFGAAATGVRAMTSSSSPGISLKQEGISYCAGADLPVLIVNVVRGGPGLGNIGPSQGDYYQAVKGGGHGDYRVIVLAPSSVSEMASFPLRCYTLAEKYRMPAMILADGVLGQMMEPVEYEGDPVSVPLPEPDWALGKCGGRERRVVRSYDLREGALEKWLVRRGDLYRRIEEEEVVFESRGVDDADLVLVAYGTSARACTSAMKMARDKGLKVGVFRPVTLWPFPRRELYALAARVKRFLVVEMSLGQMVDDVRLAVRGRAKVYLHSRPAAIPSGEGILAAVEEILSDNRRRTPRDRS